MFIRDDFSEELSEKYFCVSYLYDYKSSFVGGMTVIYINADEIPQLIKYMLLMHEEVYTFDIQKDSFDYIRNLVYKPSAAISYSHNYDTSNPEFVKVIDLVEELKELKL